jgi:HEPN domain-containing protein
MKKITEHWLNAAAEDLLAAKQLLPVLGLTNLVAFHAQQCLEKSMKALLEEMEELSNLKTHDLLRLYRLIKSEIELTDTSVLVFLNQLYTDARYPGDAGLMPEGKPSNEDALSFVNFTEDFYHQIKARLAQKFPG